MKTNKIKTQNELQQIFKNSTLYLKPGSTITYKGNLILGNNIEFSGINIFGIGNKINSNCQIMNVKLGINNTILSNSIIQDSEIKNDNSIGPFCFLRQHNIIGSNNNFGTFVEIKKSKIDDHNKMAHNIFLGDCEIKSQNIIGAGVITANYDKGKHHKCKIGNKVFIGCNSTIISPVKIENNVIIAAGSKINFDLKKDTKIIQKNTNYFTK